MTSRSASVALALTLVFASSAHAQSTPTAYQTLGRDILRELIETNTTYASGSTTRASELLAARFRAAGFPAADVQIVGPDTGRDAKDRNLVVRYRGNGRRKPILLIGHLDVVEARRADWVQDPFTLTERDGHFYGRGTLDMKNGAAAWVAALLRMKQEGIVPAGDYVLALTAGEEGGGGYNGIQWLLANRRDLLDAEYVLNPDAGGGELRDGKPIALNVQAAEKVFHSVHLTVRNPGGHSSAPRADNAIYELADALKAVQAYRFPVKSNDWTLGSFKATGPVTPGPLGEAMTRFAANPQDESAAAEIAKVPTEIGKTRTTCVATMLRGGHASNALPQTATATVSCRIFPDTSTDDVKSTLEQVVGKNVQVSFLGSTPPAGASPLRKDVLAALTKAAHAQYPGIPVVPGMVPWATDGAVYRAAGIPTYGVSGSFIKASDSFSHGLNERLPVESFYGELTHWYVLLKELAGKR